MTDLILQKENFNEMKKAAKRALHKLDSEKQCVLPIETFFQTLSAHNIKLSDKGRAQSVHDFADKNGQINYLDALRYIQATDYNLDWDVIKTQQRSTKNSSNPGEGRSFGATAQPASYQAMVYGSPVRKFYNTNYNTSMKDAGAISPDPAAATDGRMK